MAARPLPVGRLLPRLLPFLLALAVAGVWGPGGVSPAAAAYIGPPQPVPLYTFRNGMDVDFSQRTVTSSRFNPLLTFHSTRYLVRETYGLTRLLGMPINVEALFGISRAELNFGTVDMTDGGTFWNTYAPNTGAVGSRRALAFGQTFGASYGVGARAQLFRIGNGRFGFGGQILTSTSTDTHLPAMRLRYNEWDAYVGAIHESPFISIYYGADASWLKGELALPDRATDLEQADVLGGYAGMRFRLYRHLSVTSELRMLNQLSWSMQMLYHY
ncbi:MAG: hypothetical protein OEW11_06360 [Nitrospirota bacterium]|nr:hypothetical protein [Nitrospirota bacterium]